MKAPPTDPVPAWRGRADRFWYKVFGPVDGTGAVVVAHRGALAGYPGCYIVARDGATLVSAPDDLVPLVEASLPLMADPLQPPPRLSRLPCWVALGPSVHSFTATAPAVALPSGCALRPATAADLGALRADVAEEEWTESGFGSPVDQTWVLETAGRVAAAANLTLFDGVPADVGVLTAAWARGRGLGAVVAGHATAESVCTHGIARWRALATNVASRRLAARLGFADDCRQLAVRPPERDVWLRPLTDADIAAHNAGEDDETVRWLSGGVATAETTRRHFGFLRASIAADAGKRGYGVWERDRLAGYIDFDPAPMDGVGPAEVTIAYGVHTWARGRGIATAAVEELCRYLAQQPSIEAAVIRVDPENHASIRVAERSGFSPAGDCQEDDGARLLRFRRDLRAGS